MSNTSGKILVACGWESGHREQTGAPGLHHAGFDVGTTTRTGSYSAQFDGGEFVFVTLGSASVENIGTSVGFYIAARAGSPGDLGLWDITNSGYTVYVTSAGKLALKAPGGSTVWTGTYTISNTTWYVLWLWCNRESSYYWTFDVRLYDNTGATLHDSTGGTTTPAPIAINTAPSGIGGTNSIYLGSGVNGMGVAGDQLFMDDLIVTSGGPAPIGPKIVGVVPTGDGTNDDFAETSGGAIPATTYDDVNDMPLGASDATNAYSNASSGSKTHQTYTHAAVSDPASSGNILCINVCFRMARDSASSLALCQPLMRTSGGQVLIGRNAQSTGSYVHNTNGVRETSQAGSGWISGSTGENAIDNVEFGMYRSSTFQHAKFSGVMMEVAWGANYTDDTPRQTRGGQIL